MRTWYCSYHHRICRSKDCPLRPAATCGYGTEVKAPRTSLQESVDWARFMDTLTPRRRDTVEMAQHRHPGGASPSCNAGKAQGSLMFLRSVAGGSLLFTLLLVITTLLHSCVHVDAIEVIERSRQTKSRPDRYTSSSNRDCNQLLDGLQDTKDIVAWLDRLGVLWGAHRIDPVNCPMPDSAFKFIGRIATRSAEDRVVGPLLRVLWLSGRRELALATLKEAILVRIGPSKALVEVLIDWLPTLPAEETLAALVVSLLSDTNPISWRLAAPELLTKAVRRAGVPAYRVRHLFHWCLRDSEPFVSDYCSVLANTLYEAQVNSPRRSGGLPVQRRPIWLATIGAADQLIGPDNDKERKHD